MALDPTARRANIKDSVKKFCVDNFETIEGLTISFDTSMRTPILRGQPIEVTKWVGIDIGGISPLDWTSFFIDFYCCTRKDSEGFQLAQLRDKVLGYLTDSKREYPDGMARITFYRSFENQTWTKLGAMMIGRITESDELKAPDETKYIILSAKIMFASKL